jgi:hypothetical protein
VVGVLNQKLYKSFVVSHRHAWILKGQRLLATSVVLSTHVYVHVNPDSWFLELAVRNLQDRIAVQLRYELRYGMDSDAFADHLNNTYVLICVVLMNCKQPKFTGRPLRKTGRCDMVEYIISYDREVILWTQG